MASKDKDETKKSSPGTTERAAAAEAGPSANKAQLEYERYLKRMGGAAQGSAVSGYVAVPVGGAMPGWAVPPSVASMMPAGAGVMMPPGFPQQGSLTSSLGSTIRLGVDLVNAALAGGARMLNGIAGGAYGYEYGGHHDQGCGCGGCGSDCCHDECCGTSCCPCECCQPSVGTCC